MSEKKHPATPRRKQESRKKGQVLKSQELTSSLILLGFVALLRYWLPEMVARIQNVFLYVYGISSEWTPHSVASVFVNTSWMTVITVAPVFAVGAVIATASNYLQVGSLFTVEPLMPKLSRISPIAGAKRMFGIRAWVQLAKSIFKMFIIGYFLYAAIRDNMQVFPALQTITVGQGAALLGKILTTMAWKIAVGFLVIAIADYLYQWWEYERDLKMTHEELKQEYKQMEGNPELKSAIKKRQRSIGLRRMMQDLKKADVVVTNPTHYAVALRYDTTQHAAPYVVAKGQDYLAQKIKEAARENGIVIMENRPLARALYDQAEIGQVVPQDLYKAVAEVLAFVYRLKKKKLKR